MDIYFRPNHKKVIELITHILNKYDRSKSIFILKCIFYSDKFHMQEYGVPITGDTYYKLKHGPIGTVAYDILKKNEITIPQEIINLSNAAFKKEKEEEDDDSDVIYKYNRKADMDVFSKTNIDCMDKAINFCVKNKMQNKTPYAKSDYALSEVSHQEKAWRLAENFGARLDFELIIDDKIENREEIIKYMRDVARFICL